MDRIGEEGKRKEKVKTAVSFSAHTRPSKAGILHLEQKAAKCTTCKRLAGKFYLFIGGR